MKNKYYYYVVVRSNNEARLVTKICEDTRYAHWDKDAAPISFAKTYAQDLAYCLNLNFYPAYVLQLLSQNRQPDFLQKGGIRR